MADLKVFTYQLMMRVSFHNARAPGPAVYRIRQQWVPYCWCTHEFVTSAMLWTVWVTRALDAEAKDIIITQTSGHRNRHLNCRCTIGNKGNEDSKTVKQHILTGREDVDTLDLLWYLKLTIDDGACHLLYMILDARSTNVWFSKAPDPQLSQ